MEIQDRRKTIFVGIPCFGDPPLETFEDYMRFAFYLGRRYQEYDFVMGIKTKSEQFRARNALVEAAYKMAVDYLLMIDDDHVIDTFNTNAPSPQYEVLREILAHMEADDKLALCGALYYQRGGDCRPVIMKRGAGKEYLFFRDDEIPRDGSLMSVNVQGGGFMVIRMAALDTLSAPWFEPEFEYGTDIQICRKLEDKGWKIACLPKFKLGHVMNTRRIVIETNRHLCQEETAAVNEFNERNFVMFPVVQNFKKDLMKYIAEEKGITEMTTPDMIMRHVNKHRELAKRFYEYKDKRQYYRDAGLDYLIRYLWIISQTRKETDKFSEFILTTINDKRPLNILDFGCGPGLVSFELAKRGHRLTFVDIDGAEPYEFLKWRVVLSGLPCDFVSESEIELLKKQSFDIVIALDSIEHIAYNDIFYTIAILSGLLKENGVVVTNFMLNEDFDNPEHCFMNKSEFMRLMTEHNLFPANAVTYIKKSDLNRGGVKQCQPPGMNMTQAII